MKYLKSLRVRNGVEARSSVEEMCELVVGALVERSEVVRDEEPRLHAETWEILHSRNCVVANIAVVSQFKCVDSEVMHSEAVVGDIQPESMILASSSTLQIQRLNALILVS